MRDIAWHHGMNLSITTSPWNDSVPRAWIVDEALALRAAPYLKNELCVQIQGGESCKTRQHKERLEDWLLQHSFPRHGTLVAVGGGSISDLVGCVAATYLRGISYITVPTTLLGMIDASIGGKVAINTPTMKNSLGSFHFPAAIGLDFSWLHSLPDREWKNGFAELLKYGWIADPSLLSLPSDYERYRQDPKSIQHWIHRCMGIKHAIVTSDPKEQGRRRILNFGHTLGHALEAALQYEISHGEAIAWGMRVEARISYHLGFLSEPDFQSLDMLLDRHGFPSSVSFPLPSLISALYQDKKNEGQGIRIVLLQQIGYPYPADGAYCYPVPLSVIMESLHAHAHCA